MKTLILFLLSFSISAFSQVQVQIVDPELDTAPLEKSGYQVSKKTSVHNALPNKKDRDKLLSELPEAKKWDELSKDIFYMDLKSKTLSDLQKKYPQISKAALKDLKEKRD